MPHASSMTTDVRATQETTLPAPKPAVSRRIRQPRRPSVARPSHGVVTRSRYVLAGNGRGAGEVGGLGERAPGIVRLGHRHAVDHRSYDAWCALAQPAN